MFSSDGMNSEIKGNSKRKRLIGILANGFVYFRRNYGHYYHLLSLFIIIIIIYYYFYYYLLLLLFFRDSKRIWNPDANLIDEGTGGAGERFCV